MVCSVTVDVLIELAELLEPHLQLLKMIARDDAPSCRELGR
jgi:hypothetical protein